MLDEASSKGRCKLHPETYNIIPNISRFQQKITGHVKSQESLKLNEKKKKTIYTNVQKIEMLKNIESKNEQINDG